MIPQIPTKLFLPKKLFSSLTDWTKANYTSWGWKNATIDPKNWTVNEGITMTQVDESTFSFRGVDKWGSCGTGLAKTLITGLSALVRTPKSTKFVRVQIGTTDVTKGHINLSPAFSDSAYSYFYIDALTTAKDGIGRFYPEESSVEKGMDIRFFDPYIVLKSHLKPISAGDKLGLVYWDGGTFTSEETYALACSGNADWNCIGLYAGWGGLCLRYVQNDVNQVLIPNGSKGTINLSGYGFTVSNIYQGTGGTEKTLKGHLFHVI